MKQNEKLDVIILAGYDTQKDPLVKSVAKKRLIRDKSARYLNEITNRATGIFINSEPLLQFIINQYKLSEMVDEVFIVGPKNEFEQIDVKNATIVDHNKSLGSNLLTAIETVQNSKGKNGWAGITACDLPFLNTKSIDQYLESVQPSMNDYDFIFQLVDKQVIKDSCKTPYDKPGYHLTSKNGERKKYSLGHLHLVKKEKINNDTIKNGLSFFYGNRHLNTFDQVMNMIDYIWDNTVGNKDFKIRKTLWATTVAVTTYSINRLSIEILEKSLTTLLTQLNKNSPTPVKIQTTDDFTFGMDMDTLEELNTMRTFYNLPLELSDKNKEFYKNQK